jgi:hypothetical protein
MGRAGLAQQKASRRQSRKHRVTRRTKSIN